MQQYESFGYEKMVHCSYICWDRTSTTEPDRDLGPMNIFVTFENDPRTITEVRTLTAIVNMRSWETLKNRHFFRCFGSLNDRLYAYSMRQGLFNRTPPRFRELMSLPSLKIIPDKKSGRESANRACLLCLNFFGWMWPVGFHGISYLC